MIHLHRSNRAETLVDTLAEVVRAPLPNPLLAEHIAVQGRGMERWLSMQLARRLGVWANPQFPFPRHLVELVLRAAGDSKRTEDAPDPFAPEVMKWSVAALLPELLPQAAFGLLRNYLAGDSSGALRLQLAERIATTLDQYVVFRPEMVRDWEAGRDDHWQAILWRALVAKHGSQHVAARAQSFLAAAAGRQLDLSVLPPRLSVFGTSTLPPLYLSVLDALGTHIPVHIFLLSPSEAYWADLRSRREQVRLRRQSPSDGLNLHLEEGNPLLASLGRVGREFQDVIEEGSSYDDDSAYDDADTDTVLHTLQSDILNLRRRRAEGGDTPPLPFDRLDSSLRIHACHGPMREVEVLFDQLLDLFADRPDLAPHDVLVMSPAIDEYAPFVEAVFGGDSGGTPRIPFRIADRAVRSTDSAVDAFLSVLAVCRGRMTATEVIDLLAFESVRRRFGMVPENVDTIRGWVRDSGIRWGVDRDHRAAVDQPECDENTWRFGLDRLLLGYAMPGEERRLYGGVLPYDDIEGSGAELLGQMAELCETLFRVRTLIASPRAVPQWESDLAIVLESTIDNYNRTAFQHQQIRAALAELSAAAKVADFDEPVALDSMRQQIEQAIEKRAPGRNFLTGGVTFCAMVPMRSIPFPVICLLGMNDAAFPRARRPLGFDLIAADPRPGDRSPRDDDRYLFLEALLSARERLIITYVGQSIRDNSEIPPSVVVSELLDAIDSSYRTGPLPNPPPFAESAHGGGDPDDRRRKPVQLALFPRPGVPNSETLEPSDPRTLEPYLPRDSLLLRHPLQPFSPRYFGGGDDSRLFSYSSLYCAGARALQAPKEAPPPLVGDDLTIVVPTVREIGLDELMSFFKNPGRAFLRQRLRLSLGRDEPTLDTREPIELEALDRWAVGDRLLRHALEGGEIAAQREPVRAAGLLPLGTLGAVVFDQSRAQVETLAALAARYQRGPEREPLRVDFQIAETRITGRIDRLWRDHRVDCSFSARRGSYLLRMWIAHLALDRIGEPTTTVLVSRDFVTTLRPGVDSATILAALVDLYWRGLERPLRLFERASYDYARICTRDESRALIRARSALAADLAYDDYAGILYRDEDPLVDSGDKLDGATAPPNSFRGLARTVYSPLLQAQREEKVELAAGDRGET